MQNNSVQVAVLGKEKINIENPEHRFAMEEAYILGKELGREKIVVLTGGLGGIMESISKGVAESGGVSAGFIPILSAEEEETRKPNKYSTIKIKTGMDQRLRIPLLINSSNAIIVISGGMGAWLEASFALANGIPIITLPKTGGTAARLALETPFKDKVIIAKDALDAAASIIRIFTKEDTDDDIVEK